MDLKVKWQKMRKLKIKNEINETLRDKIKYPVEKNTLEGFERRVDTAKRNTKNKTYVNKQQRQQKNLNKRRREEENRTN